MLNQQGTNNRSEYFTVAQPTSMSQCGVLTDLSWSPMSLTNSFILQDILWFDLKFFSKPSSCFLFSSMDVK